MTTPRDPAPAFGAPGMPAHWTSSSKEGIGTAYHTASRLWFTLSHGIVNEIYYPTLDQPNTRDLQLLITDGESFFHEERADLLHEIHYPEKGALAYELINRDPQDRYRIVKTVISDPYLPVLLIRHRVEIFDLTLRDKLRVFTLLSPTLSGSGQGNCGEVRPHLGELLLQAHRHDTFLCAAARPSFQRASVGYVGASDGWQDLAQDFQMDWEFRHAPQGNIAFLAEHTLDEEGQFTLAVGFGNRSSSAMIPMLQSLAVPFEESYQNYVRQWSRVRHLEDEKENLTRHTGDGGSLYRLSRCILQAHEDKLFQGALIASASIPWGDHRSDHRVGGYHLVWPRDMLHSSCALLSAGQKELPLRSLVYLSGIQREDGSVPQNVWLDGQAYWDGHQLDEVAAPIILARRLAEAQALQDFDPWPVVLRAAAFMLLDGPSTGQERWEENAGFSPSTIAALLAGTFSAHLFAEERGEDELARLFLDYTDWVRAHLVEWTCTHKGTLDPDIPSHFVRIVPEAGDLSGPAGDPADLTIEIANAGGLHRASDIVDGGFLSLVRYGFFDPHDPLITNSLKLIDRELKIDFPGGPCWRRYQFDGYGSQIDGGPYDETHGGYGGGWPILTGERGHYELDAGRDPRPYLQAMENFANEGGMMPEQLWPLPEVGSLKFGQPAGSAMPLCWSHAEYLSLVHSAQLGHSTDRLEGAHQRYVLQEPPTCRTQFWSPGHRLRRLTSGQSLTLLLDGVREVRWRPLGSSEWQLSPTCALSDRLHLLEFGPLSEGIEFFNGKQSSPERIEVSS